MPLYLREHPLPHNIADVSKEQGIAFSFLHNEFIKHYQVITDHECWHSQFGSGGTRGAGSGEEFLLFHRLMMEDMKHFLDIPHLPVWLPEVTAQSAANAFPLAEGVRLDPRNESLPLPPADLTLRGNGQLSLANVSTIDALGQRIGMDYHSIGHSLLRETMGGFESPRAPHFYAWHGALDNIVTQWLQETETGQAWLQSNQSEIWRRQTEEAALAREEGFALTSRCDPNNRTWALTITRAPLVRALTDAPDGIAKGFLGRAQTAEANPQENDHTAQTVGLAVAGGLIGLAAFYMIIRGLRTLCPHRRNDETAEQQPKSFRTKVTEEKAAPQQSLGAAL